MSDTPKLPKLTITAEVPNHRLLELMDVLRNFYPDECTFMVIAATELRVEDVERMFKEMDMQFIQTIRKN